MTRRRSRHLARLAALCSLATAFASHAEIPAPSPFPTLQPRALTPPLLDVAPICLPGERRDAFAEVAGRAAAADLDGARHKLAGMATEFSNDERQDAALASVVLESRRSGDIRAAREALNAAITNNPFPRSRACARIELARLALRARLLPEARAALGRVARELADEPVPSKLERTIQYYRAETAMLEGRRESAHAAYEELAESETQWLSRAARLRLADLAVAYPVPESSAATKRAWKTLRGRLDEARGSGVDTVPWSVRAAEIAIAAEDYDAAHRWLADAERLEGSEGVASIRKADVLVALERGADARNVLERVASAASLRPARELASVRRAGYGLGGESTSQRIERLGKGASSIHPHVAASARFELAKVLLASGDIPGTLEALARLAYTGALPGAQEGVEATLDRAVLAADRADVTCPALLERLGGRRSLFIGLTNEPDPFLRLGDCFLELGMPGQALDVYRQLARRFGAASERGLPLRIARASLASEDLPILRATLRAHFADQRGPPSAEPLSPDEVRWRWLRAQLDLRDGENANAAATLDRLARQAEIPAKVRVGVEQALARLDSSVLPEPRLGVALASSLAKPLAGIDPKVRAEAWLRLADLQRQQGRNQVAHAAYRRAAELLTPGYRRSRALFSAAQLASRRSDSRANLAASRDDEAPTQWSTLASAELRLIALRAAARGEVLGP